MIYGLILHEWIFKEFACLKSKKEKNDIRKGDYIKDHNKEECSANIDKQQKNWMNEWIENPYYYLSSYTQKSQQQKKIYFSI